VFQFEKQARGLAGAKLRALAAAHAKQEG
jgi:hypothetical protein